VLTGDLLWLLQRGQMVQGLTRTRQQATKLVQIKETVK
jgi:hypothetical protein